MKLHLDNNIIEGTPEELVECLRLAKEVESSEKSLFHFGHEHQPTENDKEAEEDSVYDKGAFYTVTDETSESALPVGVILQHQHGKIFEDSKDVRYIISNPSYVNREHVNGDVIREDRFELAKQLGIQLTSTTDLAQATEGKYFKVTVGYPDLIVGDIVTIVKDDKDNQPQCKDRYSNFCYVYLHHLELLEDDEEEEEFDAENYSIFSPEAQTPSTDIQVGDRVKILKIEAGAEGEATVTAILEDGNVELEGIGQDGIYLTNWSNHISNLEKIEEGDEQEEPLGYTFWYIDDVILSKYTVLKKSIEGYFEDSEGYRYTRWDVSDLIKPIDREDVHEKFEEAKRNGRLLKYNPSGYTFIREH